MNDCYGTVRYGTVRYGHLGSATTPFLKVSILIIFYFSVSASQSMLARPDVRSATPVGSSTGNLSKFLLKNLIF
jgi:hypothetical protein